MKRDEYISVAVPSRDRDGGTNQSCNLLRWSLGQDPSVGHSHDSSSITRYIVTLLLHFHK